MAAHGHALRKAFPLAARFRGSIDAFAVDAELPAMENATQAVPFVARQAQARAAMRACFLQKADPSVGRAEGDEVLAEEAHLLRAPSASSLAERHAGTQYSRNMVPIGVPGPIRVSRVLSAELSMFDLPIALRRSAAKAALRISQG
jgi:hypothetical protein